LVKEDLLFLEMIQGMLGGWEKWGVRACLDQLLEKETKMR
jgi:hypothetical protein